MTKTGKKLIFENLAETKTRIWAHEWITKHIGIIPPKPVQRPPEVPRGRLEESEERFARSKYWLDYLDRRARILQQTDPLGKMVDAEVIPVDRTIHGPKTIPNP